MNLKIVYENGMFNIDSGDSQDPEGFTFSLIEDMYRTDDNKLTFGYGYQVNNELKRERIKKFCINIYNQIKEMKNGK